MTKEVCKEKVRSELSSGKTEKLFQISASSSFFLNKFWLVSPVFNRCSFSHPLSFLTFTKKKGHNEK